MSIFTKIFGDSSQRLLKNVQPTVERINSFEPDFQKLSADQLKEKTKEFKDRLQKGETLDDLLPEAFALAREAGKRTLNQRHFDVQLIGGMVLNQGKIAEMRTGEGKTLSATLPAYLNALEGKGVHIVTVNDYLAKRDTIWMGQIYDALGLSVGCVTHEGGYIYDPDHKNPKSDLPAKALAQAGIRNSKQIQNPNDQNSKHVSDFDIRASDLDRERDLVGGFKVVEDFLRPVSKKEVYAADITYGTNHEFGFDYLRDNMVYDTSQQVQRGFNFAIVDEVDSILIDEARVPLIISGEAEDATERYRRFAKVVKPLEPENLPAEAGDYTIDEKAKAVQFTDEGQNRVVRELGSDPWLDNDITTTHQLESALKAKALFTKDKDYVVKNGEIVIIDEFTGRMLPGRRWSQGLHQAIEAKENVTIKAESLTLATITFQNFFRMYKKLSGMTGTAVTSAEEFDKVYNLEVALIPTHRPLARHDQEDKIYKNLEGKLRAVVTHIKELNKKGQPVLVGTRSVEKNEFLGQLLDREGIKHEILNAKNHEREGEIIAQAGRAGAVTIATNMAGRGVDIILGGNPANPEEAKKVRDLGGLHVIGTERHDARRIDNQLRGRAGRQGDLGSSQFFVSLEDDLMRIFGGDRIKPLMTTLNVPDDEPIQAKIISGALESAQAKIEGFNFDSRKHLLEYDDVMNKHREIIYKKRKEILEMQPEQLREQTLELIKNSGLLEDDYGKKEQEVGNEQMQQLQKIVSLNVIDTLWREHLTNMEHMRDSVGLRAYGGKDPLVEYKNEGHRLFKQLLAEIDATIANNVLRATFHQHAQPVPKVAQALAQNSGRTGLPIAEKVGRNNLCPCGSGKKFKKCHGK